MHVLDIDRSEVKASILRLGVRLVACIRADQCDAGMISKLVADIAVLKNEVRTNDDSMPSPSVGADVQS